MVTPSGDLVILAVQRQGQDLGEGESELAAGDAVLLRGTWSGLNVNLGDPDVLVVDAPDAVRRQTAPLGIQAAIAIALLGGMVVLLVTGAVPAVIAGLLAAGGMVLLRVINVTQAYRAISWTTIVLIGGLIPLSTAMIETGAADDLANVLVTTVGDAGPYALLIGLFVLTVSLGQLISNTATALIITPIAVAAAFELDVNVQPLLMTVTVAAAASFLTPVATPANLMVMEPGGYRFTDYARLGLPMLLWFFVVAVAVIPLFWRF
jgi:di/tricarboxylate transporter